MEETTNNNKIEEQILDRLNDINDNTVSTNNSLNDLQEYLIIQEQKRNEAQAEEDKKTQESEEKAEAEQSAKASAQEETYTELLTDIRTEIQLTNQMLSGSFLFMGIIAGILLFKILWDKLT